MDNIKVIRYGELAEDLLSIYKYDSRIQKVDTFDEMVAFLKENPKDLIYRLKEEIMNRTRGFEFLSIEQHEKDFEEIQNSMYERIVITMPRRGTARSAGYDIFAPFDFELKPMEEIKIPTGIKAYMLDDECLKIYPRSGLGFKYHLKIANTIPVIDSDYFGNKSNEGHIYVKLRNEGDKIVSIRQGEAFCQAIFEKYLLIDGDDFTGNERMGGFGSTGR